MQRTLIRLLPFALPLVASVAALASSLGPLYPGTAADDNAVGTRTWSNPSGVAGAGGTAASATLNGANPTTHYLKATNFGLAVPAGATITGVVVEVERADLEETDAITDFSLRLVKGGVVSGADRAGADRWPPSSMETATYGESTDMWGLTLTPADVNASNFGVVLSATSAAGAGSPAVDFIRVTVHYTASSGVPSATTMLVGSGRE